jgi:hypothetical protein
MPNATNLKINFLSYRQAELSPVSSSKIKLHYPWGLASKMEQK